MTPRPLTICHIIVSLEQGGAQAMMRRLCEIQSDRVRQSVIAFMDGGPHLAPLQAAGIDVVTLGMSKGPSALAGLPRLYRTLKRMRPDVVQTWMYHADLLGGLAAKAIGVPHVLWNIRHTDHDRKTTKLMTRVITKACAWLSSSVPDRIVCCAQSAKEVHVAAGYKLEKFVIIPNGYDFEFYAIDAEARASFRSELGVNDATLVIGSVGRWAPQKDHATLLEALCQVEQEAGVSMHGVLAGTGCTLENSELRSMIGASGVRMPLSCLGERSDIPRILNGLDLFVLSSSHGEAFPNVVAEALACGTSCVVTDVGDAALIVGDRGRVVRARDPAALAEAINETLSSSARDGKGDREKNRASVVARFSIDAIFREYEALWMLGGERRESHGLISPRPK